MNEVNLNQQSPIETFTSNFHYAWNSGVPLISVEHYVVNWAIEKLQLLFLEEHKSVTSPEFVLSSSNTAWFFEVYPNGLCNAAQYIDILIKRSGRLGPTRVGLTYRFGVLQTNGKMVWLEEKKTEKFLKNSFRKVSIKETLCRVLSEDKFKYGEVFEIACDMYVTYAVPEIDADSLEAADHDLANFAFDMTKLMKAVEVADFTLHAPSWTARTHKAIVAARSTAVRKALESDSCTEEVRFQEVSSDSFLTVLHYMYSGNLTSALKDKLPGIDLYESACAIGVSDLMDLLSPGRLRLRSVLQSQELSFTWIVRDFMKRCNKVGTVSIKSQGFSRPSSGSPKWHLITEFDKDSDKLGVLVETTSDSKSVHHSILKISLLDGNGEVTNTRLTTHFRKPGERFGFPDFLYDFTDQNLKYELLVDDILRVHCELLFVVSSDLHESHDLSTNHPSSPVDTYRALANDVYQLFKSGAFSDLTVRTYDGSVLAVHKSILFARSRKFHSKILYYNKGERNMDVFDVEPCTLRLMIEHAYSGTLKPMSVEDLLRIHKEADTYVFRHLTLATLHQVASQINIGNVFRLLDEGKKLRDRYLCEKCLLFLSDNAIKVMQWTDWEEFRRGNPDLCDIVMEHLNEVTSGN